MYTDDNEVLYYALENQVIPFTVFQKNRTKGYVKFTDKNFILKVRFQPDEYFQYAVIDSYKLKAIRFVYDN